MACIVFRASAPLQIHCIFRRKNFRPEPGWEFMCSTHGSIYAPVGPHRRRSAQCRCLRARSPAAWTQSGRRLARTAPRPAAAGVALFVLMARKREQLGVGQRRERNAGDDRNDANASRSTARANSDRLDPPSSWPGVSRPSTSCLLTRHKERRGCPHARRIRGHDVLIHGQRNLRQTALDRTAEGRRRLSNPRRSSFMRSVPMTVRNGRRRCVAWSSRAGASSS